MALVITNTNHTEIAVRYAWLRREQQLDRGSAGLLVRVRMREIERLFFDRYGGPLPDDDAGLDDLEIAAHHIAHMNGDAEQHILAWAKVWAPWLWRGDIDPRQFAQRIAGNPRRFKADTLAWRLRLTMADRSRLGITTIGAIDCNAPMRATQRQKRSRIASMERRRAAGATPREASAAQTEPWLAVGMSRATWYRKGKPMPETNANTADEVTTMASTKQSHRTVKALGKEAFDGKVGVRGKSFVRTFTPEYPVPAVEPHLAEAWLLNEIGDIDDLAGGRRRFDFLRRELIAGTLYRSAIPAASRGIRSEVAA